jgi:hypothetical protein
MSSVSLQPTSEAATLSRLRAHALIAADALEVMALPWSLRMRAEILRRMADCEAARMMPEGEMERLSYE